MMLVVHELKVFEGVVKNGRRTAHDLQPGQRERHARELLVHLLEMILDGAPRPAAIVGVPVGFIGAAESKEALIAFAGEHGIDIPYVTVRGRRGGSAMAASALNAIAQERE